MSDHPIASVIVPAYLSHTTIETSLESLTRQSLVDHELIVVDSSPDDRSEQIVRNKFPNVKYHHSQTRMYPHQARNHGASIARGGFLAFADPDCVAAPDWLERLADHHRNGRHVVGGAIRGLPGWWNQGVHVTKYGWWLPGARQGPRTELPSGNLSVTREAWTNVKGFQGRFFAGDSEICWRLREAGYSIWFDPDAVVTHLEHAGPAVFFRERFQRGRDFGRMRVQRNRWSRMRCLIYLLAAPVLPWVMIGRSLGYAARGRYLTRWLSTLPVQIVGLGLWCLGEALSHGAYLWRR